MWAARSDEGGARMRQQGPPDTDTEIIAGTGLFEPAIHRTHSQQLVRPAEAVVAVENTRATSLSWPDDVRLEFTAELRHQLLDTTDVHLSQQTSLTIARVLQPPGVTVHRADQNAAGLGPASQPAARAATTL
jgi:hypothetical protein